MLDEWKVTNTTLIFREHRVEMQRASDQECPHDKLVGTTVQLRVAGQMAKQNL